MATLTVIVAIAQIALALLLLAASLHLFRSALAAASLPEAPPRQEPTREHPMVTVQLPLRNERAVAARVMESACTLDWPRDRIEFLVLDDSDDETMQIVDSKVEQLRNDSFDIRVIRRPTREGYKAGALQNALSMSKGEYFLLLDADSVVEPDLLHRLIAPFAFDEHLAFTQARWSFENEEKTLLTRVSGLILEGLMVVEQALLSARKLPVQFNGTAGLWRRSALEKSGGWLSRGASASVTEDLDLSYRARLAGFIGKTLPEVSVRTELPETMAAFRSQQDRWVRGGGEALRALVVKLTSGELPARERLTMLSHLARHSRQPLLLVATIWLPLSVGGWMRLPLDRGHAFAIVVSLALFAIGAYYAVARRRLGQSGLYGFVMAPVVVSLSMGLCLVSTRAFLRGLFGGVGEFVRTPKAGAYRSKRDALAVVEVALGLASAAVAFIAALRGDVLGAVGLGGLVASGLLWVGIGGLRG